MNSRGQEVCKISFANFKSLREVENSKFLPVQDANNNIPTSIRNASKAVEICDERTDQFKTKRAEAERGKGQQAQPYLRLNDGNEIPMLGLGTWNAQGEELKLAVKTAIACGYRHIDTASNYRNEHLVGEALNECIREGLVSRKELFVTTKLWNNSHSRESVSRALQKSLEALNLTYVDMYLIHYPIGYLEGDELSPIDPETNQVLTSDVDYLDTWLAMEQLKLNGLARSIGISNFNCEQVSRLLKNCFIKPSMNQVECHPYLNQKKLIKLCRENSIQVTAYSPLGSPGKIDEKLKQRIDFDGKSFLLLEDPTLECLARKYQKSVAQILIKYQLQRNIVCIPKAIQLNHIKANFESIDMELSHEDMSRLDSLDKNVRFMKFERCSNHKFYPFNSD